MVESAVSLMNTSCRPTATLLGREATAKHARLLLAAKKRARQRQLFSGREWPTSQCWFPTPTMVLG
eukprot:7237230-Lingulodinium_polyedra.AAC.1